MAGPLPLTMHRVDLFNRAAKHLNRDMHRSDGGWPTSDGTAVCPECGRDLPMMCDPQEWTRVEGTRHWEVTAYWGAFASCCGWVIADNFGKTCVFRP